MKIEKNNSKKNIFTLIMSVVISLIGCEIFLRTQKLGFNNSPLNPSATSHHEHPYEFEFTSYSPYMEWNEFLINYDKFGNRYIERNCAIKSNKKEFNIFFIGDSFVTTNQIENKNNLTGIFQNRFCEIGGIVHNFGVSSYSPILSYSHLMQQIINNSNIVSPLNGSSIIHVLYDNDIEQDKFYSKLSYEIIQDGEKITVVDSKNNLSILQKLSRNSYLVRLVRRFQLTLNAIGKGNIKSIKQENNRFKKNDLCRLNKSEVKETVKYIRKIKSFAISKGIKYYITALPHDSRRAKHTNYNCFKMIAKKLNLIFFDAPEEFFDNPSKYYFKYDTHLNVEGNKAFANKLIEQFQNVNNF